MLLDWRRLIHGGGVNVRQCVEGCRGLDIHGGGQRPGCSHARAIEGLDLKGKPWPLGRAAAGLGLMSRHFQNAGLVLTLGSFSRSRACLLASSLSLVDYDSCLQGKSFKRRIRSKTNSNRAVKAHQRLSKQLGRLETGSLKV